MRLRNAAIRHTSLYGMDRYRHLNVKNGKAQLRMVGTGGVVPGIVGIARSLNIFRVPRIYPIYRTRTVIERDRDNAGALRYAGPRYTTGRLGGFAEFIDGRNLGVRNVSRRAV